MDFFVAFSSTQNPGGNAIDGAAPKKFIALEASGPGEHGQNNNLGNKSPDAEDFVGMDFSEAFSTTPNPEKMPSKTRRQRICRIKKDHALKSSATAI